MKTKDLASTLSGLINQNGGFGPSPATGPVPGNFDDTIPEELQQAPVFEINYKSEQKQSIKKAKDSILVIVKDIVPHHLQNSALILDKVNQDAEQLGNLYYQYKKKEICHQALMNTIASGQTDAKRFEVFDKLSVSLEELGAKITEFQNQLRKYYIDTYLDIESKGEADCQYNPTTTAIGNNSQQPSIMHINAQNVITGTDETVKMLLEKKKQALMAKYQEAKESSEG